MLLYILELKKILRERLNIIFVVLLIPYIGLGIMEVGLFDLPLLFYAHLVLLWWISLLGYRSASEDRKKDSFEWSAPHFRDIQIFLFDMLYAFVSDNAAFLRESNEMQRLFVNSFYYYETNEEVDRIENQKIRSFLENQPSQEEASQFFRQWYSLLGGNDITTIEDIVYLLPKE